MKISTYVNVPISISSQSFNTWWYFGYFYSFEGVLSSITCLHTIVMASHTIQMHHSCHKSLFISFILRCTSFWFLYTVSYHGEVWFGCRLQYGSVRDKTSWLRVLEWSQLFFWPSSACSTVSFSLLGNQYNFAQKKISIFNLNLYFRSRFPIVRDDLLCQFCTRTAVGSAVIGMIVRTVESRVDTMTVHICSGNDPNHGKGPGREEWYFIKCGIFHK